VGHNNKKCRDDDIIIYKKPIPLKKSITIIGYENHRFRKKPTGIIMDEL